MEDVIIENKQAREMVEMYSKIMGRLADTFSSIISNNLNQVMKFLASVTIYCYSYSYFQLLWYECASTYGGNSFCVLVIFSFLLVLLQLSAVYCCGKGYVLKHKIRLV